MAIEATGGGKTNATGAQKFAEDLLKQAQTAKTTAAKKAALKTAVGLTNARTSAASKQIAANQAAMDAAMKDIISPEAVAANAETDAAAQAANIEAKKTIAEVNALENPDVFPEGSPVPGSSGKAVGSERTLALDTFKNTFALVFGRSEANKAYLSKLYDLVSGFYKTGSTIDEALNLAMYQAKEENAIPEFTDRFKGIFALNKMFQEGKAVQVPTIAEFFQAEAKMGEVLNQAGLGDLATQEFLGNIIGTGKSVLEVGNIISDVFTTIDNAPKALKDTLSTYFPGVDRVSLAKALLTGPEGAAALSKKVKQVSVLSAAGTQGLTVDMATAGDIAAQGYGYQEALTGFGQIARELPTYQKLQEIEAGKAVGAAGVQSQLQSSVFGKDIQEQMAIEAAAQREVNRFRGQAGTIGSRSLASQNRGLI